MARRAQLNTGWNVVLLPEGTLEEAEAAARRARKLVTAWIIRNARNVPGETEGAASIPEGRV